MFTRLMAHLSDRGMRACGFLAALVAVLALLVGSVPAALAAPHGGASSPASAGGSGPKYTHHMTEKIHLSASACASLKAAYPTKASDPNLCIATHNVEWTDVIPLTEAQNAAAQQQAGTVSPYTPCDSGSINYHDEYVEDLRLNLELYTTFSWGGYCGVPALTYENCYVSFALSAEYKDTRCFTYTYPATNPDRRAAAYEGYMYFYEGPGVTVVQFQGQRRECYKYYINDCTYVQYE